jgi:hypothetical protein
VCGGEGVVFVVVADGMAFPSSTFCAAHRVASLNFSVMAPYSQSAMADTQRLQLGLPSSHYARCWSAAVSMQKSDFSLALPFFVSGGIERSHFGFV